MATVPVMRAYHVPWLLCRLVLVPALQPALCAPAYSIPSGLCFSACAQALACTLQPAVQLWPCAPWLQPALWLAPKLAYPEGSKSVRRDTNALSIGPQGIDTNVGKRSERKHKPEPKRIVGITYKNIVRVRGSWRCAVPGPRAECPWASPGSASPTEKLA